MTKKVVHKTAHGNVVHVIWSPDGLEIDTGDGPKPGEEETAVLVEHCGAEWLAGREYQRGESGCSCPQARMLKEPQP